MKTAAIALLLLAGTAHAGPYIETGVAVLDEPKRLENHERVIVTDIYQCKRCGPTYVTVELPTERPYDINETRNPYGSLILGWDFDLGDFTIDLQAQHQSSLDTNFDRGFNALRVNVRWYPFGR